MAEKKQEIKTVFSVIADQASKDLKQLRKNFKLTEVALKDFADNATSLGALTFAPLAGVMASLGATVANSLSSFVEYGTGVADLASKIGASAQDLQLFQYAAQMSGSSAEEISGAIEILGKNLGQVSAGKNKAIPEMFKELGVSLYNVNGELKTATELLPEVANCIRSQDTAAQKAYIANTLFGKSGQSLIQMLEGGSEALNELTEEAENFGIVLSDDALGVAGDYDDALNRMQYSLRGVQYSIANQVLPVLTPLVESMTECIASNREWIASSIADVAKDVASAIEKIDFKACITGAVEFAKTSYELFEKLGGLKTIAIGVAAVFTANFTSSLMATIGSIGSVVKALWGLNAALLANPAILLATTIAVAIGAIAYQVYKNWDEICARISKIWQNMFNFFASIVDKSKAFWNEVCSIPEQIKDAFGKLSDFFNSLWQDIKNTFFEPFSKSYEFFNSSFDAVKNFGSDVLDNVTGFFNSDKKSSPEILPAETLAVASGGNMQGEMEIKIKTDDNVKAEVVRNNTSNNLKTTVNTGVMRGSYVPV